MPLPLIPIIAGAASLITGAYGVKKGMDAKRLYEQAKEIGESAERRHRRALRELDEKRQQVYKRLTALGERKRAVFETAARIVVEEVQQARATAEVHEFGLTGIDQEEIARFSSELAEMQALDVSLDTAKSAALAALGAGGIYATVGALATASTGTAIGALSGAAATNATLAWLGGGSLATGGLGVAGGAWALGGLVAGPALAITGFTLASKAEEAVTQAEEFAAEVKQKIAELEPLQVVLDSIRANIDETGTILDRLQQAFDSAHAEHVRLLQRSKAVWSKLAKWLSASKRKAEAEALQASLLRLITLFKAIKEVVQTPLLDEAQMPLTGLRERLGHVLEVADVPVLPAPEGEKA